MANTNPLRIAADTADANVTAGNVTETLLDALMKRTSLVLTPTETLSAFNFATGSPPYSVIYGQTGYVYFYNPDDAASPDDGLTVLVSGDGRRYILADMSAVAIASVLAIDNDPPVSPVDGDAYVVDVSPTGAWVGHAKDIALATPRGWVFAQAKVGTALLDQETGLNIQYSAAGVWGAMSTSIGGSGVTPGQLLFPMGLSVEAQQNTPPGSPGADDGLYYLVGLVPTGAWSGKANKVATYDSTSAWVFLTPYDGSHIFNKASDADLTWFDATGDWRPQWPIESVCYGRISVVSATPVPPTDQTAKATLYLTRKGGSAISLYVNGAWALRTIPIGGSEPSLSLAGYTASKNYDIFAYDTAGVPALESLVWTDDTTRATALALQDGIYVKSGDATRRYMGTIYTTATGQTEDSAAKRMVRNYYNRVRRSMRVKDTTTNWNYTSTTLRQARATAANQLEFVVGVAEDEVSAQVQTSASSSNVVGLVSIGLDSTTTAAAEVVNTLSGNGIQGTIMAEYAAVVPAGRHRLVWLEAIYSGAGTITYWGVNSGMTGHILA